MSTVKTLKTRNLKTKVVSERFDDLPTLKKVVFQKSLIAFHLSDKRIISIPLAWVKKLQNASEAERNDFKIRGHFVFWENYDEIIGVKNLLNGTIIP
jgi:hypothetical protein